MTIMTTNTLTQLAIIASRAEIQAKHAISIYNISRFRMIISGLPRSMLNADQYQSIPIRIALLIPMAINKDQCRSMPSNSSQLRGISQINSKILIGIYLH